ncbi:hypothetical protein ACHAWF_009961 [Thalassiosira exigua]
MARGVPGRADRFATAILLVLFATFVGADPAVDVRHEESAPDASEGNDGGDSLGAADPSGEEPTPLPASLRKATRVGARLREARDAKGEGERDVADDAPEEASEASEGAVLVGDAVEGLPRADSAPHKCPWGSTDCHRGAAAGDAGPDEANSSAVGIDAGHPATSLAGSATAKIEAHVLKGRGKTLGRRGPAAPPTTRRTEQAKARRSADVGGHEPPKGFRLAGRIVASPSDGLSYFLDVSDSDPASDVGDWTGDWTTTIPYAYLRCGPTIESTTEAFPSDRMVVRHLPASASVGHWTNLGGGVTIEGGTEGDRKGGGGDEEDDEGGGARYIDGNGDGHPQLLVALTPIEITVSGNGEESRTFGPGAVVLMEDTLGKGHKIAAAPAEDPRDRREMSVLTVALPHAVHYPTLDEGHEVPYAIEGDDDDDDDAEGKDESAEGPASSPPPSYGAEHALFGLAPRDLHRRRRGGAPKHSPHANADRRKPCPLDYDSASSSLFAPDGRRYQRLWRSGHRHRRRRRPTTGGGSSSYDESRPPPPGFSTYDHDSALFDRLPSLRRTMLFALGLSLTSSFVYCVQLLYPPLLVLWGGASMVAGGALASVLAARWGYRNVWADWEEEWRWKREVARMRAYREEAMEEEGVVAEGDDVGEGGIQPSNAGIEND